MDEGSGYLPPHELAALAQALSPPASPGITTTGPSVSPSPPAEDPGGLALLIARVANDRGLPAQVVPTTVAPVPGTPESVAQAASAPASPGVTSSQLAPSPFAPTPPESIVPM
jgi:hypothetical protein